MSLWKKMDDGGAYCLDRSEEYRGRILIATGDYDKYIDKWLVRHNYTITCIRSEHYNETDTTYEARIISFAVSKYGIHRTIHIPRNKRDRKLYLDLFDKHFEVLRENKDLKKELEQLRG